MENKDSDKEDTDSKMENAEPSQVSVSNSTSSTLDSSQQHHVSHLSVPNSDSTTLDTSQQSHVSHLSVPNSDSTTLETSMQSQVSHVSVPNSDSTTLETSEQSQVSHVSVPNSDSSTLETSKQSQVSHVSVSNSESLTLDTSQQSQVSHVSVSNSDSSTLETSQRSQVSHVSISNSDSSILKTSKQSQVSHVSVSNSNSLTLDASQINQNSIIAIDKDGNQIPIIISPLVSEKNSENEIIETSSNNVSYIYTEGGTSVKGESKDDDEGTYETYVIEHTEGQDNNLQFSILKDDGNSLVIQIPEENIVANTEEEQVTASVTNMDIDPNLTCECDICGDYFTNLKDHLFNHPDIETLYSCDTCGKLFASSERLTIHLNIHASNDEQDLEQKEHMRKSGMFKCETCGKTFTVLKYLQAHRNVHLELKRFSCEICGKKFAQKRYVKAHELLHQGIKPFKCDSCDRCFTNITALKAHQNMHSGIKPYKCDLCGKGFYRASNLSAHAKRHKKNEGQGNEDKRFRCECNLCFPSESELQTHIAMHTGEAFFKCTHCTMEFRLLCKLQDHCKIHMENGRSHQCQICGKAYGHKNSLRSHLASHAQEKLWECKICHKKFSLPGNLKTHEKLHTGLKPHQCMLCDRKFARIDHLRQHIKVHQGIRPFKCDLCGKAFTRSHHYQAHLSNVHNENKPHECIICHKKFGHEGNMRTHLKLHFAPRKDTIYKVGDEIKGNMCRACKKTMDIFEKEDGTFVIKKELKCQECDEYFHCAQSLIIHRNSHIGDIPFRCNFCAKQFNSNKNLNKHLKIHTGVRAYSCNLCNRTFIFSHHLKRHERFHDKLKSLECEVCGITFSSFVRFDKHKKWCGKKESGIEMDLTEIQNLENRKALSSSKKTKSKDKETENLQETERGSEEETKTKSPNKKSKKAPETKELTKQEFTDSIRLVPKSEKTENQSEASETDSEKAHEKVEKKKESKSTEETVTTYLKSGKNKDSTTCQTCGKKFATGSNLKRHNHAVHNMKSCTKNVEKSDEKTVKEVSTSKKKTSSKAVSAKKTLFTSVNESKDDGPHKCHMCKKSFTCLGYLMQHLAKHAGDKPFQCDVCGKGFAMATNLKKHRSSHTLEIEKQASPQKNQDSESSVNMASPLVTGQKNEKSSGRKTTKRAMYIIAGDTSGMEVDMSGKADDLTPSGNSSQSKTRTQKNNLDCDICGLEVSGPRYMKQHQKIHRIGDKFGCEVCKKTFSTKFSLKQHRLKHKNIKTHLNKSQSEKKTPEVKNLDNRKSSGDLVHKSSNYEVSKSVGKSSSRGKTATTTNEQNRTTRGNKLLKCEICGKEFHLRLNLMMHQNDHKEEEEKPYECHVCGGHFTRSYNLKKHMKLHEGNESDEKISPKKEKHMKLLKGNKSNQKISPKKGFSESREDKNISTEKSVKKSRSSRIFRKQVQPAFKCDQLSKEFTNASSLKLHKSSKHVTSKPFRCDICSKQFTREYNLLMHKALHERAMMIKKSTMKAIEWEMSRKRQINKCSFCGKQFHLAYNLKLHLRTHIKDKPYKCKYCPSAFTRESNLINHNAMHRKIKKEAGIDVEFDSVNDDKEREKKSGPNFRESKKSFADFNSRTCLICGGTFFNTFNLERHLLIHAKYRNGSRQKEMQPKKKKVARLHSRSSLTSTKIVHNKKQEMQDEIVKSSVPKSSSGGSAEKIIYVNVTPSSDQASLEKNGAKPFQGIKSSGPPSREKIYQCHICNKILSRAYNLKKHLERHTENYDQTLENISALGEKGGVVTEIEIVDKESSVAVPENADIVLENADSSEDSTIKVIEDGTGKEHFRLHLPDLYSGTATETSPQQNDPGNEVTVEPVSIMSSANDQVNQNNLVHIDSPSAEGNSVKKMKKLSDEVSENGKSAKVVANDRTNMFSNAETVESSTDKEAGPSSSQENPPYLGFHDYLS